MSVDQQVRDGFDHGMDVGQEQQPTDTEQVDPSEHLLPTPDKYNDPSQIPVSHSIPELRSITQGERVEQFETWLEGKEKSAQGAPRHSFSRANAKYWCARIQDVDRLVQWRYQNPHTIMITGGGGCFEDSRSTPILDYHDKIHSTHSTVRRALRRVLGDRDYASIKLYTPSKERNYGQTHWHEGIWVDGKIDESDLKPVIGSYVRNCDVAKPEYHSVTDAVSVEPLIHNNLREYEGDKGKGPTSAMAGYLVNNLVSMNKEGVDVRSSDFAELLWSAQLSAENRNKVYTSGQFDCMADEMNEKRRNQ